MPDLEYHDIGEYCKVQISHFLNYLCNGCTWDNEYRRDLTKLIKDIIDEILDFYNLKDDFYLKKECKRFSKVDLDILILIAKNIDSKAWLYGGYIDWSLINM